MTEKADNMYNLRRQERRTASLPTVELASAEARIVCGWSTVSGVQIPWYDIELNAMHLMHGTKCSPSSHRVTPCPSLRAFYRSCSCYDPSPWPYRYPPPYQHHDHLEEENNVKIWSVREKGSVGVRRGDKSRERLLERSKDGRIPNNKESRWQVHLILGALMRFLLSTRSSTHLHL